MPDQQDQLEAAITPFVQPLGNLGKTALLKAAVGFIEPPDRRVDVSTSPIARVASNLIFESQAVEDADGNTIQLTALRINTVLMTVSLQKNIVKTPVQGLNGTIKEYIADQDYRIRIEGGFFDSNPGKYPAQLVADLVEFLKVSNPLRIASSFLQRFSIHDIVIESYSIPEQRASRNTQRFLINAISDLPVELREVEERIIAG